MKNDLIESIVQDAVSVRSASLESKNRQRPILIEDIEELEEQMRTSLANSLLKSHTGGEENARYSLSPKRMGSMKMGS